MKAIQSIITGKFFRYSSEYRSYYSWCDLCLYILQNRKRKEELFFGLFTISLGFYMSFINQKVFFLLFTDLSTVNQIRLQLGIIPLALLALTFL